MPEPTYPFTSVRELTTSYQRGSASPVDVTREMLDRIDRFDPELHAHLAVTAELALEQAKDAEERYGRGERAPLLGVPVAVKDAFHLAGAPTTLGSLVHRDQYSSSDSGVVRRLRSAGAVFTGKTNTAEFGQSATTDNRLGPDTGNPWSPDRTPGGSSGGSAAAVAAGLCTMAVGSDGGGSIRIPAAFTGLVGVKPTSGLCVDERGFRAMSDFVSPGPLARSVDDARVMLEVLAERRYPREDLPALRIAWCPRPENRPVDPGISETVENTAKLLEQLGHQVETVDLPVQGWEDIFGPLVLDEEHRERGHLLTVAKDLLTKYERMSLGAAASLTPDAVSRARDDLHAYKRKVTRLFDSYDLVLTPTVAVPAFPLGRRPETVAEQQVDRLWGAFPFTAPFNVAGTPAVSLPCGVTGNLPVGAQLVANAGHEQLLLNVSEQLEEALGFHAAGVRERWAKPAAVEVS